MTCSAQCNSGRNVHFNIGTIDVIPSAIVGQTVDLFIPISTTSFLFNDTAFVTVLDLDSNECIGQDMFAVPKNSFHTTYTSFIMPNRNAHIRISVLYYELLPPYSNTWVCEDKKDFYVILEVPSGDKWTCGASGSCTKSLTGYDNEEICNRICCTNKGGISIPIIGCLPKQTVLIGASVIVLFMIIKK